MKFKAELSFPMTVEFEIPDEELPAIDKTGLHFFIKVKEEATKAAAIKCSNMGKDGIREFLTNPVIVKYDEANY